ncbi:MAG: family 2 glycosyl transferase [Gemmatimonadetes bacterium]|nr:family 2 glycosyl transferase [Gemmatimonadota bacterium]
MPADALLSIGIATKGRPVSVRRCIESLASLGALVREIVVVDDGSEPAIERALRDGLPDALSTRLRVIRHDVNRGLAASRNRVVLECSAPFVLSLDDDTELRDPDGIIRAVQAIEGDSKVAIVAITQTDKDDVAWPGMQPAAVTVPSIVASFIGYAHLLRRETFLALGGFREPMSIMNEEPELSLRLLDAGYHVLYLPGTRVAHLVDPYNRDSRRYLFLSARNNVLASLYDDPLPVLLIRVPMRLVGYFRMRRGWKIDDPGGFVRLVGNLLSNLPDTWRRRTPVKLGTIFEWRRLVRSPRPYVAPEAR